MGISNREATNSSIRDPGRGRERGGVRFPSHLAIYGTYMEKGFRVRVHLIITWLQGPLLGQDYNKVVSWRKCPSCSGDFLRLAAGAHSI